MDENNELLVHIYKTSEMGKALKQVFHNEITIDDSVNLAKKEIAEVFTKKEEKIENDTDTGFFGDKVGICPKCGNEVAKSRYNYSCRNFKECDFKIPFTICNRTISKANAIKLLTDGHTSKIEGFTSKKGSLFNATLKLDKDNKVVFDFE